MNQRDFTDEIAGNKLFHFSEISLTITDIQLKSSEIVTEVDLYNSNAKADFTNQLQWELHYFSVKCH